MSNRPFLCVGFLALAITAGPSFAAGDCSDNWSQMAGTVASNKLTAPKDLQQLAKGKVPGKLVKISLCKAYEGFHYELVFLDGSGQLVNLMGDAKDPFPQ